MVRVTAVDGRVLRGARNREAIVESLLACYEAGVPRPSAADVAARAGVSVRSVHNHFADMDALAAEVARRQWDRYRHFAEPPDVGAPLDERVDGIVELRARLFEALTPVRRAALLAVHDTPSIAANLARADRALRRQVEQTFAPEIARSGAAASIADALDLVLSWEAWNRLRAAQGCTPTRARRVVAATVTAILERDAE